MTMVKYDHLTIWRGMKYFKTRGVSGDLKLGVGVLQNMVIFKHDRNRDDNVFMDNDRLMISTSLIFISP